MQVRIDFRLPNARAGEDYTGTLTCVSGSLKSVRFLDIQVPAALGLQVDLAKGTLSGMPATAGDFDITIEYFNADEKPAREYKATLSLLVVPNPKSMWKNLPSDSSALFWRPDEASSALSSKDFNLIAASKRGRSHAHVGSFRDDDYQFAVANDWVVAVVADGAGSAKYSRRGAQIVCESAVRTLTESLCSDSAIAEAAQAFHQARSSNSLDASTLDAAQQQLHASLVATLGHAARQAQTAIQLELSHHSALQAELKDFSTTALIAIARQFTFGTLCAAYSVGDGAIGVYQQGQKIILLGDADSGEFAGQTRFLDEQSLTVAALAARTQFALVDDLSALILMSDGVSDPLFETEFQLANIAKWDLLWSELNVVQACNSAAQSKLLGWLDFWSQGNHDDRTILLITPSLLIAPSTHA